VAAVAGTSTCHLIQSPAGHFVPGIWGPYKVSVNPWTFIVLIYQKNALFPGWWMNEGGQSSTGQVSRTHPMDRRAERDHQLIEFMITTHPAYNELLKKSELEQKSMHVVLAETLDTLKKEAGVSSLTALTKDLHFYPDFHGEIRSRTGLTSS
jgi:ribulose kinase